MVNEYRDGNMSNFMILNNRIRSVMNQRMYLAPQKGKHIHKGKNNLVLQ